jgi:hypothetical protein
MAARTVPPGLPQTFFIRADHFQQALGKPAAQQSDARQLSRMGSRSAVVGSDSQMRQSLGKITLANALNSRIHEASAALALA